LNNPQEGGQDGGGGEEGSDDEGASESGAEPPSDDDLSSRGAWPGKAIEHLARIVYPCPSWADARLAMLTWAFDVGGKETDHPCIAVAAFVSSAKEWINFSDLWQARLNDDGLTFFRMSDFANWSGQFKDRSYWTESRRRALMADLLEILLKHAFRKIGCIVTTDAMDAMSPEIKKRWRFNAYVLGARLCCSGIRLWAQGERHTAPMEYVFEYGDEGRGMLETRMVSDGFPPPIFRRKKNVIKDGEIVEYGYLPLQAADILAYELFKLQTDPVHARTAIRHELDTVHGPIKRLMVSDVEGLERELREYEAAMESADRLSDLVRGSDG
jgi:hypothetical protein